MNNNKGFTLIEILATISILVIIISIAIPSVISIKNRNIEKNENNIKEIITNAAETYIYTYNYDIDKEATNKSCIKIEELLKKQLIKSNKEIEDIKNSFVQLSKNGNTITYEISTSCKGSSLEYIETSQNEGSDNAEKVQYKDASGANAPKLAEGMIPVVYDETSEKWEVADTTKEWYNYEKQWWANAVTTSSSTYRTASPGAEIPMEDINSMWVWIPRYKYRITFQTIGVQYTNSFYTYYNSNPGQIDIVFETGTNTTGVFYKDNGEKIDEVTKRNMSTLAISEYYTHPSFRNGTDPTGKNVYNYDIGGWSKELEGIWVGKFETSGSATTPTIIPNSTSLRNQTMNDQYNTALKFAGGTTVNIGTVNFQGNSTYGLTSSTDTHMMKNTEWGAVAYLSQSKYGKMGNSNYSETKKEVYPNVSLYIGNTGCSSASDSCNTYEGYSKELTWNRLCGNQGTMSTTCNKYNTTTGYNASTTGNIYGVYDMVGGAAERVNGKTGSRIFENKYEDIYSSGNIFETRILGDATFETRNWYKTKYVDKLNSSKYLVRGGSRNETWIWDDNNYKAFITAGLFYFEELDSSANNNIGFRVVLIP